MNTRGNSPAWYCTFARTVILRCLNCYVVSFEQWLVETSKYPETALMKQLEWMHPPAPPIAVFQYTFFDSMLPPYRDRVEDNPTPFCTPPPSRNLIAVEATSSSCSRSSIERRPHRCRETRLTISASSLASCTLIKYRRQGKSLQSHRPLPCWSIPISISTSHVFHPVPR